jgi:hypothetical protein
MAELAYPLPEIGEPSVAADPRTLEALINIKAWAAGQIDSTNLKAGGVAEASLKAESVSESKLTAAVAALLNSKSTGLSYKPTEAASLTAASGELIECKKPGGGTVVKCPTATANRAFVVYSGVGTNTLKAEGGAKFFGDFINGQETIAVAANQHVYVFANGTHWLIIAGEPKLEQLYSAGTAYTKAEAEAGVEPSSSRMAFIRFNLELKTLTIGGVLIGDTPALGTVLVPPGQKWKGTTATNITQLLL